VGFGHWLSIEQCFESVTQVVFGRFGASLSVVRPLIVQTSGVNELALAAEDGGLRGDFRFTRFYELMFAVDDDGRLQRVICCMLYGVGSRKFGVDVDEGDLDAPGFVELVDAVDFRNQGIGYGAVGGDENYCRDFSVLRFQRGDCLAVESVERDGGWRRISQAGQWKTRK